VPVNSASAVLRYSAQRGLDGSFNASPAHMFRPSFGSRNWRVPPRSVASTKSRMSPRVSTIFPFFLKIIQLVR
jgi:hypothetical protein